MLGTDLGPANWDGDHSRTHTHAHTFINVLVCSTMWPQAFTTLGTMLPTLFTHKRPSLRWVRPSHHDHPQLTDRNDALQLLSALWASLLACEGLKQEGIFRRTAQKTVRGQCR